MQIKNFLEWSKLKEKLHFLKNKAPFVNVGDLWWASLGENVGQEINGKSRKFSRPVIILKKLSKQFYFVIPTTSQRKKGSWYVSFRQKDQINRACLHQVRTIDYRRLQSRLGRLNDRDMKKIKEKFLEFYR